MPPNRDRREMTFWDHLEELRMRIIRSLAYVTAGTVLGWVLRGPLLAILRWPADLAAQRAHVENFAFRIFEPAGGIVLMMQVSLVAGIVFASPLLIIEMWGFFEPALEDHERRWAVPFILLSLFLFLGGVGFCYALAPQCFWFFFEFNRGMGVQPELTLAPYLYFLMRFLLAVGLSFELPVVLMIAAFAGFLSSSMMLRYWRQATVAIFVIAAIVTPTTDPVTCTLVGIPMAGLYLLSIGLVRLVERRRPRRHPLEDAIDDPYGLSGDRDHSSPATEGLGDPLAPGSHSHTADAAGDAPRPPDVD